MGRIADMLYKKITKKWSTYFLKNFSKNRCIEGYTNTLGVRITYLRTTLADLRAQQNLLSKAKKINETICCNEIDVVGQWGCSKNANTSKNVSLKIKLTKNTRNLIRKIKSQVENTIKGKNQKKIKRKNLPIVDVIIVEKNDISPMNVIKRK